MTVNPAGPLAEAGTAMPLLPARMVNEYVYCPRLAYLEWIQGEWAESADTVDGKYVHRRVDKPGGTPPKTSKATQADEVLAPAPERIHVRSLELTSARLGLAARLDLAEFDGRRAVPVDYKRGRRPHVAQGAYEPERVQLCVQGLLLEDHGYECAEGILYFAGSKERVRIAFDAELRSATAAALDGLRTMAAMETMPAHLEDSPKCVRCSLAPICLPRDAGGQHRRRAGGHGSAGRGFVGAQECGIAVCAVPRQLQRGPMPAARTRYRDRENPEPAHLAATELEAR